MTWAALLLLAGWAVGATVAALLYARDARQQARAALAGWSRHHEALATIEQVGRERDRALRQLGRMEAALHEIAESGLAVAKLAQLDALRQDTGPAPLQSDALSTTTTGVTGP